MQLALKALSVKFSIYLMARWLSKRQPFETSVFPTMAQKSMATL
jgi:hypothetical protein